MDFYIIGENTFWDHYFNNKDLISLINSSQEFKTLNIKLKSSNRVDDSQMHIVSVLR